MTLTVILSALFLIAFLFWAGLETPKGKIVGLLRQRGFLIRALLAEIVLVPILGLVLAQVFQLPAQFRIGFLLVACLPGGILALNFVKLARGNIPLAAGLVFILGAIAILLSPLLIRFFFPEPGLRQPGLTVSILLLLLVLAPLYAGRAVRARLETIPASLSKALNIISLLLFVAANVSAVQLRGPAVRELEASELAAIILLVVGSWIISWTLGGKDLADKKTFAITTSMRNFGIAMLICMNLDPESPIVGAIIAFNGIAVTMNMLFGIILHWVGRTTPAGRVQPKTA